MSALQPITGLLALRVTDHQAPAYKENELQQCLNEAPVSLRHVLWDACVRQFFLRRDPTRVERGDWPRPNSRQAPEEWIDHSIYDHVGGKYDY